MDLHAHSSASGNGAGTHRILKHRRALAVKPLAILLGCFVCVTTIAAAQDRGAQLRSRTRDATPTERPGLRPDNGRLGRQPKVPGGPLTWRGLLIDAGCPNRSS